MQRCVILIGLIRSNMVYSEARRINRWNFREKKGTGDRSRHMEKMLTRLRTTWRYKMKGGKKPHGSM